MKYIINLIVSLIIVFIPVQCISANSSDNAELETYYELKLPESIKLYSPEDAEVDFYKTSVPGIEMLNEGHFLIYNHSFSDSGFYFKSLSQNDEIEIGSFDHKSKLESIFTIPIVQQDNRIIIENSKSISIEDGSSAKIVYTATKTESHQDYTFNPTTQSKPREIGSWYLENHKYLYLFIPTLLIVVIVILSILKIRKNGTK